MKPLFVFCCTLVLLWRCSSTPTPTESETSTATDSILVLDSNQRKQLNIQTTFLQLQKVQQNLRLMGKIEIPPQHQVDVSVPIGGYLKQITTQEGKSFKKGDVLAIFEDLQYVDLQKNYLQTRIQWQQAQLELERQKTLYQSEAVGNKFLQEAQARYNELAIEQKALAEKLALLRINPQQLNEQNISKTITLVAPFDGITSAVYANVGKYCLPTDVVFTLLQPQYAQIKLAVSEKDLAQIKIGQAFQARYLNRQDSSYFSGKVSFISPSVASNGIISVIGRFDTPLPHAQNGRMMQVEIITEEQELWCVPKSSLVALHQQNYWIVETAPNRFERKAVQILAQNEQWVGIAQPEHWLKTPIVQEGAYRLLMAMQNNK